MSGKDVTGLNMEEILEAVRKELGEKNAVSTFSRI